MKIVNQPQKNSDGEMEVTLIIKNSEIKWLKSAAYKYTGDEDDKEEIQIRDNIRATLLECKNKMNPS